MAAIDQTLLGSKFQEARVKMTIDRPFLAKLLAALSTGFALTIPFEKLRGPGGLGIADVFSMLFIMVAWLQLWRNREAIRFPLIVPMLMILGFGVLGALSFVDVSTAIIALVQEIYLYIIFLTLANAFSKWLLLVFSKAWLVAAIIESGFILMDRFRIGPAFLRGGKGSDPTEIGRALGTFMNSNAAGGYMMISIFLLLALRYPRNPLARLLLLGLFFSAIIATGSNGALIGAAAGLAAAALYWLFHHKSLFLLAAGAGSIGITLLSILLLTWPVWSAAVGSLDASQVDRDNPLFAYLRVEDKLDKRTGIWGRGIDYIEHYPFGIGPNVSKTLVGIGLHNDYLAFYVERGAVGFLGLMLLLGQAVYWLLMTTRLSSKPSHSRVTGALLGALVAICVTATNHEVTHARPVWLLLAMMFLHYRYLTTAVDRLADNSLPLAHSGSLEHLGTEIRKGTANS